MLDCIGAIRDNFLNVVDSKLDVYLQSLLSFSSYKQKKKETNKDYSNCGARTVRDE